MGQRTAHQKVVRQIASQIRVVENGEWDVPPEFLQRADEILREQATCRRSRAETEEVVLDSGGEAAARDAEALFGGMKKGIG